MKKNKLENFNELEKQKMFIVFEGVDGCGKDTQLNKIFEYLGERNKNLQIWKTKEPTANTNAGKEILNKLKNKGFSSSEEALSLYVKDRIEQTKIRTEILTHSTILSSRFDYSTYAYQGASGINFNEIYKAHDYSKIIIPDITFIFYIDKKNIEKRLKKRGGNKEFFENLDFLEKVNQKYIETEKKLKEERKIYLINGNKSIQEVYKSLTNILDEYEF